MASLFTTGPALLYASPMSQGGTPEFIGTAEQAPKISVRTGWMPVMNDIGGQRIAHDYQYHGKEAFITAELNRMNWTTVEKMLDRTSGMLTSPVSGVDVDGDIGTLMLSEGAAFKLYMVFPYAGAAGKAINLASGGTMGAGGPIPTGYRFFGAFLEGPDDLEPGTRPLRLMLTWHALRVYDPSTRSFTLYDNDVTACPSPN